MFKRILSIVEDLIGLFYPRICAGCNAHLMKHEQNLCIHCLYRLPKTYFWDYDVNPVEELFHGRLKVHAACAFLHYEKGTFTQHLIHRLKYENRTSIGTELGVAFGHILKEKSWFTDADFIIPMPLHPAKEARRGYNQSNYIADGLSEVLQIPVQSSKIRRVKMTDSQTKRSRYQRSENVDEVFKVNDQAGLIGKNVILVDDVVTSGATLIAAGSTLL
ncbi:MAG: ComF family protein, partial [Bacteroidetes bacterium]